jgi:hypothetical protein
MNDPHEQRTDPFYEFGSFGCTGCHSRNLLHPKKARALAGARLAFAQGGHLGFRLVCLTPPILLKPRGHRMEACWSPAEMPFRYEHAPVLAWNEQPGDFPLIERIASATARTTVEGGFSSRFRSRTEALDAKTGNELVRRYERIRDKAPPKYIACGYEEALPYQPPSLTKNRRVSYMKLLKKLGDEQGDGDDERSKTSRRCCG